MTRVEVNPGVCGLVCTIEVERIAKQTVKIAVATDCQMIGDLGESLMEADLGEILTQPVESVVYRAASQCKLHPACPVPSAIIKGVEVETGMALPRDVAMHIEKM